MKPFTQDLKLKLDICKKNRLDASELLKDIDIKGQDLSHLLIGDLHLIGKDISGTNFAYSTIGTEGKVSSFISCNISDCNFNGTRFEGKVLMHKCNAKRCNFRNAYVPTVEYKFTDFTGSTFCHTVLRIGSDEGIGCTFDANFFKELTRNWGVEVEVRKKEK